jgi:hypothetical protein
MTYEERIEKYGEKILAGKLTIDHVPARYRKDVETWLEEHGGAVNESDV